MNFLYLSAAPTDPALKPGLDVNAVTPGTIGFVFTLVMAVAVILLAVDMSRRIRRVRYQAQLRGEVIEPGGIPVDPRRGDEAAGTAGTGNTDDAGEPGSAADTGPGAPSAGDRAAENGQGPKAKPAP